MLENLQLQDESLTLNIAGKANVDFHYFWLRDNARDPVSFDERSHQRELFTGGVDAAIRPVDAVLANDGTALSITWPDLEEPVIYQGTFLDTYSTMDDPMRMPEPVLWDAAGLDQDDVRLDYQNTIEGNGITDLLGALSQHGFAVLTDTPCNQDSVANVVSKIGYVRETIFGGLWEFEANEDMADSAFTPKELRPHTDGTYSHDAPGLQMLLCMEYDAVGGSSIMVDGLRIADEIRRTDPELFDSMTRIGVTGIYKGDGVVLRARRPIFRLGPDGRVAQVTFNNYDRDTVRLPADDMKALYRGIRRFDTLANSPDYQWRYTLSPGEMLVFDNWRVLHGRAAFQGRRKMSGAYVNREDYESRVRTSGLLT